MGQSVEAEAVIQGNAVARVSLGAERLLGAACEGRELHGQLVLGVGRAHNLCILLRVLFFFFLSLQLSIISLS